ncbi:MAG: hypothetical protein ACTSPB_01440 [Candidatus Thorarchaeota archaeon]
MGRKRKSPRKHSVHTKHPRYNVKKYERGQRCEYPSGSLRNSQSPKIYFPNQTLSDFKEGDLVGVWEINKSGTWYLWRGWKIDKILPSGTIIMTNSAQRLGQVRWYGGENLAKRMVKMSRKDHLYDYFKYWIYIYHDPKKLDKLSKQISYSDLPEEDKKTLYEHIRVKTGVM